MSIKKAYNSWSEIYDINENKTRDLDQKATIETLSKYAFDRVLELGCGTGKNTEWLITKAKKVIGIDFSEKMLAKAKEKIHSEKVHFIQGDLTQKWEVAANFADLITCSLTLEHIQDLDSVFKQANNTLKNEGLFFISELHPFKQYSGSKARYEIDGKVKELDVYTHHISEYLEVAKNNNFKLLEINEWFDEAAKTGIPRLISFVFITQSR